MSNLGHAVIIGMFVVMSFTGSVFGALIYSILSGDVEVTFVWPAIIASAISCYCAGYGAGRNAR